LIVALHGTSGNEREFLDGLRLPLPRGLAEVFVVCPFGHGNAGFEGIGESDVWDAVAMARRQFPIDPDRIYLAGHSMGAGAAFRLGVLRPGYFAAAVFVSPLVDPGLFDASPRYVARLLRTSFPFDCISNLAATPTCWLFAASDRVIPATQAWNAVGTLQGLNAEVEYRELSGEQTPTWSDALSDREVLRWLLGRERSADQTRLRFRTPSILYPRRSWIEVQSFDGSAEAAEIEAQVETETEAESQIGVYTTGVGAYALHLGSLGLDRRRAISLFTNNDLSYEGKLPSDGSIRVQVSKPGIGPVKTPTCCGPWRQAFARPFLYVVGTPEERDRFRDSIRALPVEDRFFLPPAPILLAHELTREAGKDRNLVCFGTLGSNPLLAELLHQTPIGMEGTRIRLGAAVLEGPDLSLHMVYPSPYSDDRLVQLNVSVRPEDLADIFAVRYHIPDYIVLDEEGRKDPTGWQAPAAGWFTPEWSLDTDLLDLREPETVGR